MNHRVAYIGIGSAVSCVSDCSHWGFRSSSTTSTSGDGRSSAAPDSRPTSRRRGRVGDKNYVDECETALLVRRMWTIPLVVIGSVALLGVLVATAATSARESLVR